jgi:hypothetical protein
MNYFGARGQAMIRWKLSVFLAIVSFVGCQMPLDTLPPNAVTCVSLSDCPTGYQCQFGHCYYANGKVMVVDHDDEQSTVLEFPLEKRWLDGGLQGRPETLVRRDGKGAEWQAFPDVMSGRLRDVRPGPVVDVRPDKKGSLPDSRHDPDTAQSRACQSGQTRACYPRGVHGCSTKAGGSCIAPCRFGTQRCVGGLWDACRGAVTPKGDDQCRQTDTNPCPNPGPNGRCP